MKLINLCLILILGSLISCKTAEDIRREQLINTLSMQMVQSQKLLAEEQVRVQQLEERLGSMTGKIEETDHQTKTSLQEGLDEIQKDLTVLKERHTTLITQVESNTKRLDKQSQYIDEVIQSLKKITGVSAKSSESLFEKAVALYKKGKNSAAEKDLLEVLSRKESSYNQKGQSLHHLGMISYTRKKYQDALSYFSRLFSVYPKSAYAAHGLYFLAKSFQNLKKNEEAKQTLEEMITRYPKSRHIPKAKKLLKEIP